MSECYNFPIQPGSCNGDGTLVYSVIWKTERAGDQTQNKHVNHCTLAAPLQYNTDSPDEWPNELLFIKKVNRKVQEEPQAEASANPRHQEEEKKWHRLTCA